MARSQLRRNKKYCGPGIGPKGKAVLTSSGTYSIKYRDPYNFDAYKQQGIGEIYGLPLHYCKEETFIAAIAEIYKGIDLKQADGFISMDFFHMDENGFLIVEEHERYFELNSKTGQLVNLICKK